MVTELRQALATLCLPMPLEPVVWSVVAARDDDVRAERAWQAWEACARVTAVTLFALCRHASVPAPRWSSDEPGHALGMAACVRAIGSLRDALRAHASAGGALPPACGAVLDGLDAPLPAGETPDTAGADLTRFASHARLLAGDRGPSHLALLEALASLAPAAGGLHPVVQSAGTDATLAALVAWLARVPPCGGAQPVALLESALAPGERALVSLSRTAPGEAYPAGDFANTLAPGRAYLALSDRAFAPLFPAVALDDGPRGVRVGWLAGRDDAGAAEYETYVSGPFRVALDAADAGVLFGPALGASASRVVPAGLPRRVGRERALTLGALTLALGAGAGWARSYLRERRASAEVVAERVARAASEGLARGHREALARAESSARNDREARLRAEELIDAQGFGRGGAGGGTLVAGGARAARGPAMVARPGGEAQALVAGIWAVGPSVADGEAPAGAAVDALSNAAMALRRSFPIHARAGERFAAAFSADGRRVLAVTDDGRARLWDAGRRAVSGSLRPQPADVVAATFSPDGARLITFESARDASLWDAQSGRLLARLSPEPGGVRAAVFSPDGARVAAAGGDGVVRLFESRSGHPAGELRGHEGAVRAVAFSADSTRLATCGEDASARTWDAATARQIARLATRGRVGFRVAFAPDGQSTVVLSAPAVVDEADGSITATPGTGLGPHALQIFDPATGAERAGFDAEANPRFPFAFAPDGARLATAALGRGVELWDPRAGNRVAELPADAARLAALTFAPDGTRGLTMDAVETRVWDGPTGHEQQHFDVRATPEGGMAVFAPDGARVFAAAGSAGDGIYSVETGEREALLRGNTGGVLAAEFSPDGEKLLTAGADRTVRVWETDGGEVSDTLQGHAGEVYAAHFGAEGRVLTASRDGTVRVWGDRGGQSLYSAHGAVAEFAPDGERVLLAGSGAPRMVAARTGNTVVTFAGPVQGARAARFLDDGARAAVVDRRGAVTLWDVASGRALGGCGASGEGREARADFSADGTLLLEALSDGTAELWNVATGARVAAYPSEIFHATVLALSPDGARAVSEDNNGEVAGYDARTGAKLWHVAPDPNAAAPDHVLFSPDGARVLTTSPDEAVRLYDAQSGALALALDEFASGAAFSPDGGRVALVLDGDGRSATNGTNQQFVRVWDLGSQRIVATLDGHPGAISAVRFSRDGTRLATASDDHSVRVWDAASGALLATLQSREELVSAEFSPDGLLLRASGPDGVAQIFPATAEGVLSIGCRLIRPLPEWDQVRRYCDPVLAKFQ